MFTAPSSVTVGVVGLGYVGLPLAVSFASRHRVIGYDIDSSRVEELAEGRDRTLEVEADELTAATGLSVTTDLASLREANVYIVTTPTPIDEHRQPDLRPLLSAAEAVATTLNDGDVVVFESTVYPGATEEQCVPVLERVSGLTCNTDFFVGYSPERINPGDRVHRFETIVKVTSGSTPEVARFVDELYGEVVHAGTHRAPSIRVAEAAKVIENTQRDLNIALMNELALVFNRLDIDTHDVLAAAGTKWNFLPFQPGLVGGHCIGVDPYYLTHKAQAVGYHPEIILAGRRLNDSMGRHVVAELIKRMTSRGLVIRDSRVLLLGLTFKQDTPDLRNTRVVDIIDELEQYGVRVDVHDPWVDPVAAQQRYGVQMVAQPSARTYDGIVLAVPHRQFVERYGAGGIRSLGRGSETVVFDLKNVLPRDEVDLRL